MSTTARRLRPISRWISVARPSARRSLRVGVLPGSIAYSAVSQPIPFPSRNEGTVLVTAQLSEIIEQVQTLTPSFDAVNEGVKSQSISAEQISDALSQLSVAAQQTADSLRQSNMAIEQLNDAARGLQSGVAKFTQDG